MRGGSAGRNQIIYICGRKSCGKTYYANRLAREIFDDGTRVLIIAPSGGFSLPGVPVLKSIYDFDDLAGRSAIVEPEDDQIAQVAFAFAYEVAADSDDPLWIFIDEIDYYLPPHQPDADIMRIIRYGRHRNISLVGICQRPASVRKDLLAQADKRVIFSMSEPNDCAYLKKWLDLDLEKIRALPERQYIIV